MTTTGV
jgi:hypothetical protein